MVCREAFLLITRVPSGFFAPTVPYIGFCSTPLPLTGGAIPLWREQLFHWFPVPGAPAAAPILSRLISSMEVDFLCCCCISLWLRPACCCGCCCVVVLLEVWLMLWSGGLAELLAVLRLSDRGVMSSWGRPESTERLLRGVWTSCKIGGKRKKGCVIMYWEQFRADRKGLTTACFSLWRLR